MKCPQKDSQLYKRLISQLPEREAYKLYNILTSEEFDIWYGDGSRDKDGNPYLDKYFVARSSKNKPYGFFGRIKFDNLTEVERFFSSQETKGISKYGDYYYVSKNNRIEGVKIINALQKTHPGLIKTTQYWTDSQDLGKSDQSIPVMRIVINEGYFKNDYYNSPKETETRIDSKDYIINRLKEYNQRIYDNIRNAKRDKDKEALIKYQSLFDKNQENIIELETERTIAASVKQAEKDLKYVQSVIKDGNRSNNDLIEAGRLIDLYSNISEVGSKSALITEEDIQERPVIKIDENGNEYETVDIPELTKQIQELGTKFSNELTKYNNIIKDIAVKEFNTTFDESLEQEELFKDTKDLGFFSKARGTNSVNNNLINLLSTVRSAAVNKSNDETKLDNEERINKLEGLKKSSLYQRLGREKFMKLLWQKNKKGKETGGLVHKFSDEYWKSLKSKYHKQLKSKDKAKITQAKLWHYNNHEYVNYFESEEDKQKEINRLADIIGSEAAIGLVEEQAIKFEDYRELKDLKFQEIDGSDLSKEEKQFEKDKWIIENSPEETIKTLKSGQNIVNPKGGYFLNSFEFVRSIPLKVTRDNKKTNWYDKNYEEIEKDIVALEYLEYVQSKIKELLKFYPQSYLEQKGIHKGFIPQIKEGLLAEFKNQNLESSIRGLKEVIRDWYSIKTFSKSYDHIDPGTGSSINTLNISMLSPKFKTIDGGKIVETNNIVTDIDEILSAFIPVTNMYKHKSRIEGTYKIIAESTKLLQGVETSPSGTIIRNGRDNEALSDKNTLNRLKEIVNFEIDTFYGVHQTKQEKAIEGKILSKEEKQRKQELEEILKSLNESLEDKENLTEEEEKDLRQQKIRAELELSDIGKNISPTKSVKSFLKWYQLLAQGWNIHSPVIELVYGYMSNFIHASGKGDFDSKQLRRAYNIALSNSKKFQNVVDKFNMVGEVVENDKNGFGNSKTNSYSIKQGFKPYYLQKISDRVSKGSAGVAVLLNTEIIDKGGNKSNLYDALDNNGNLKEEFQTEENINNWNINLESQTINEFERTRAKINEVNIKNMGNYDPNQPIPINSHAAGQAVLQFRRWLLEGIAQRFEGERMSHTLKRKVKGRYITYKDIVMNPKQGWKTLASTMFLLMSRKLTLRSVSNDELIKLGIEQSVDIENMRKNATGVMITIMIMSALLILSSIFEDDEDKDFSLTKYLLNMGGRLNQDLWFYSNPGEANSFLDNIVPSMKLYDKVTLWGETVFKTTFPDFDPEFTPQYIRGEFKGWDKWKIRTGELIPGSSSLIKAYRLGAKIL